MAKRIVYYHEDEGKKCPGDTTDVTVDEPEKDEEKKKKKGLGLNVASITPNWIKASAGQTVYGYTGNYDMPPLNEMTTKSGMRQSLNMKEVPQHEVPEDVRKRLLKKAQHVISAVNSESDEYAENLLPEGPSLVSTRPEE